MGQETYYVSTRIKERERQPRPVPVRFTQAELKLINDMCEAGESLSQCIRRVMFSNMY